MSGEQGAAGGGVLSVLNGPGKLKEKPKLLQAQYEKWISFQPPWVEGISSGFFGAFQGAFLGTLMAPWPRAVSISQASQVRYEALITMKSTI